MTGEALYLLWAKVNRKLRISVDSWEDVDDQEPWDELAEKLELAEESE